MKNSEILRLARTYIESGKKDFVCFAIAAATRAVSHRNFPTKQCHDLQLWVTDLLDGESTYNDWLEINYPERFAAIYALPVVDRQRALRPGRLAWMDWMIAYWEAQEQQT